MEYQWLEYNLYGPVMDKTEMAITNYYELDFTSLNVKIYVRVKKWTENHLKSANQILISYGGKIDYDKGNYLSLMDIIRLVKQLFLEIICKCNCEEFFPREECVGELFDKIEKTYVNESIFDNICHFNLSVSHKSTILRVKYLDDEGCEIEYPVFL